jgi:hypothetical protein
MMRFPPKVISRRSFISISLSSGLLRLRATNGIADKPLLGFQELLSSAGRKGDGDDDE